MRNLSPTRRKNAPSDCGHVALFSLLLCKEQISLQFAPLLGNVSNLLPVLGPALVHLIQLQNSHEIQC